MEETVHHGVSSAVHFSLCSLWASGLVFCVTNGTEAWFQSSNFWDSKNLAAIFSFFPQAKYAWITRCSGKPNAFSCNRKHFRLQSDAPSVHNVLLTFLDHWFVWNFRNTASYPRGKEAAHTPLQEYKNSQNSPHLKVCTRPLRFKFQWISPSLGSWWVWKPVGW